LKHTYRRKIAVGAAISVLVATWVTVSAVRSARNQKPTVETARVERGTVTKSVSATGVLQPLTTIDVKSNAAGRVDVLAVDVGSVVKPGQLIAKIDPTDSQTALNQAQADLAAANAKLAQARESLALQEEQTASQIQEAEQAYEAAKARLAQAEAQAKAQPELSRSAIRQAEASYAAAKETLRQLKEAGTPLAVAQAKAAYDQARAALDKSERQLERQQALYEKGFVSASQLDVARADYQTAKAQMESAKERVATVSQDYDAQMKAAEARLEQAAAALENAKANAVQDRIRMQELAAAKAALKQAAASLQAARSNARQNRIKMADIRSAQAQVVRSRAQVDNARVQLDYTTVRAPRAGVVLARYVEAGTIITSGRSSFAGTGAGTSIVQLGDLSRMFVLASVDETDIAQIEPGQQVDITFDAYPDEIFEGKVTRIDPQTAVQQNVTTVPVTVELDTPDPRLKPGMNATCEFIVERKEGVLVVPSEAVKEDEGSYSVTVIRDGKQIRRKIEIGIAGDENTEVVSGLKEGETVVTAVIEPQRPTAGGVGGPTPAGLPRGMGGPRFR